MPKIEGNRVHIPKLGAVKFKLYRPIKGKPIDATIRKDSSGRWWLCIQCDVGEAPTKIRPTTHIGIDVGLTHFAALSNGEMIANPRFFRKSEELLGDRQRELARKTRGSKSRTAVKRLVARAHERIHNQRLDFVRKLAKSLFSQFDVISTEDLNIRGMVHGNLAKSILDASWNLFNHALACKAEEAGKRHVLVDPRGTSQRCHRCNVVSKKTLLDRVHTCPCGPPIDRDVNAALNIDGLGLSLLDGCRKVTSTQSLEI